MSNRGGKGTECHLFFCIGFGYLRFKHRQVTDLDVTDLGFSGPRIPFCATGALWGRATPFFRSLF